MTLKLLRPVSSAREAEVQGFFLEKGNTLQKSKVGTKVWGIVGWGPGRSVLGKCEAFCIIFLPF